MACNMSTTPPTENVDSDSMAKKVLDKAWNDLIDYMKPDPILNCDTDLFGFRQRRDIKEEKNTTEKNRSMISRIRAKRNAGYTILKDCLTKTEQSKLAELLECIEKGEDTLALRRKIHDEIMHAERPSLEEAYSQLKTKLRNELIQFYRSQHSTIHLSPLLDDEEDTPLLEFYVMPDINEITLKRAFGGGSEEKSLIPEFRSVFFKDGRRCCEIYLTADAGLGKTAFSKRLALTWCHAKDPNTEDKRFFTEEEITTMDAFDFIFLVFLRDSFKDCHIIDMVWNQIISDLELENCSVHNVEKIFSNENCLVILDGLDEWSHPLNSCRKINKAIPHRKAKNCTVLTTTRPWKLSIGDIKASQIDQRLEIAGLNKEAADSLKRSVISHLCGEKEEYDLSERVEDFNRSIAENKISNLENIPIIQMYFLCLYCEKKQLGRSLCILYSNITEMLLSRTVKIHKEIPQLGESTESDIPPCFKENEFCRQFYTLLSVLGKLAFYALLKETREENKLVFDRCCVEQYLKKDCLNFCLRTGILTQSKLRGKLTKQEIKLSFAHKTVQEFFAALYSIADPVSVQEIVLSKCKCIGDILEMSKVLVFLSGINETLSLLILPKVINIANNDHITREYSTLDISDQLKEFQDLCVSCSREFTDAFQHNLCLQDVFIDRSCQQKQYIEHLKQLTIRHRQNIKLLYMNMSDMKEYTTYSTAHKVIDYFDLCDLKSIEKIHYKGDNDVDILPLLNSTVKSLSLSCGRRPCSWSLVLFKKVTALQKLEAILIGRFRMNHSELCLLLDYISQRDSMTEIDLSCLYCTDHMEASCTGLSLDLSRHISLKKLSLGLLHLSQAIVNMTSLERCSLVALANRDLVLKFLNCADSKLDSFYCWSLQSSAAIDSVLDTLRLLRHVRYVELRFMNLGKRTLTFSPDGVNIERLDLRHVKLEASTFSELVDSSQKLPQSIEIFIVFCTISPKEEFEKVKEKLKTSKRHFRILKEGEGSFLFETVKDGD